MKFGSRERKFELAGILSHPSSSCRGSTVFQPTRRVANGIIIVLLNFFELQTFGYYN